MPFESSRHGQFFSKQIKILSCALQGKLDKDCSGLLNQTFRSVTGRSIFIVNRFNWENIGLLEINIVGLSICLKH